MTPVNIITRNDLNHHGIERCIKSAGKDIYDSLQHAGIEGKGIQIVTASGRATCRLSGNKIPKGTKAIKGLYDFSGYGSHTAQTIYISLPEYLKQFKA